MTKIDLFQTIRLNDIDAFYSEIDKQDINQTDGDGRNLLHITMANNNVVLAKELIAKNIDVNHRDKKKQTPLHYAATRNCIEIAEMILSNGGSMNLEDSYGNQPLWTAVFNARGNYQMVNLFLKFKPDIYHKNKHGRSPLDFAHQINDELLIDILMKS